MLNNRQQRQAPGSAGTPVPTPPPPNLSTLPSPTACHCNYYCRMWLVSKIVVLDYHHCHQSTLKIFLCLYFNTLWRESVVTIVVMARVA